MDALTNYAPLMPDFDAPGLAKPPACEPSVTTEALTLALERALDERRRAECMAHIQSDAVQLALDVLVTGEDIVGYFKGFIKSLVDNCESHACGVWLRDDEGECCDMWMAYIDGRYYTPETEGWAAIAMPREAMASHLRGFAPGLTEIVEYTGDDTRLPEAVRDYNTKAAVASLLVAPLTLGPTTLGWMALATGCTDDCEAVWRRAVIDATARQGTLALHHSRQAERSRVEARRQARLEERNRIARDIHDTLTQGFAAILMQLQAAQRSAPDLPPQVTRSLETAVDLARSHMIEARRSVGTLRPRPAGEDDLATSLARMVALVRRTTEIPIDLQVGELPTMGGMEREVLGIAQEALTNAVRHSRAQRIVVRASTARGLGVRVSVADDGRGINDVHAGRGFGLTSMQERADRIGAALTVVTAPRAGTEVVLAWQPPSFSIPGARNAAQ
ncbi:sensor histidine kinase [Luteitalea pratensis]|nr:sensor histidine kinase [Luteitalea pratensis]